MNKLSAKHILLLIVILITAVAVCDAQSTGRSRGKDHEKALVGKNKKVKTKKTRGKNANPAEKAKKEAAKKKAKGRAEYFKFVAEQKKHAFDIQAPETKEHMKQNQKDISAREKNHKKETKASTRRAQQKYKK